MGFINLLKNGYRGKLGETVGQKWKNQLTVRTYQATNNSKSKEQLDQRAHYKALITQASKVWPSSINIKAPKGKSMSDFNYYTHLIEELLKAQYNPGQLYYLGQYNRRDIISPYTFLRDNSLWLYVNLPQGNPQTDFKTIVPAVLYSTNGLTGDPYPIDRILTGDILEKKLKVGTIPAAFSRGYFVKTIIGPQPPNLCVVALGKRKGSVIKWSGFIPLSDTIQLSDQVLEDL